MTAEKLDRIFQIICQTIQQVDGNAVTDQNTLDDCAFTIPGQRISRYQPPFCPQTVSQIIKGEIDL